jgi:hypothetical protein
MTPWESEEGSEFGERKYKERATDAVLKRIS